MADDGQNYSIFNSRLLVDVVGDVTDEALKASRSERDHWSYRRALIQLGF